MSLNIRHSVTWDSFKDGCWKLNNAPWPLVSLFLRFRKNPLNYHFGGIYLCFFFIYHFEDYVGIIRNELSFLWILSMC